MCMEKIVCRFLYLLSELEGRLVQQEYAIAYIYIIITCGCSVLGGEYESVIATAHFRGEYL